MVREIRVWIPESISAVKEYISYFIRNPTKTVIGVYGFTRWLEEHQKLMRVASERNKLQQENALLKSKNIELSKELSALKRQKPKKSS